MIEIIGGPNEPAQFLTTSKIAWVGNLSEKMSVTNCRLAMCSARRRAAAEEHHLGTCLPRDLVTT
jgi:hypothetical protein